MGTPTRRGYLRGQQEKEDVMVSSKRMVDAKKSHSIKQQRHNHKQQQQHHHQQQYPLTTTPNRQSSSSSSSSHQKKLVSLLSPQEQHENVENNKNRELLSRKESDRNNIDTLIPCEDSLPAFAMAEKRLRKSPRMSVARPKLSPRMNSKPKLILPPRIIHRSAVVDALCNNIDEMKSRAKHDVDDESMICNHQPSPRNEPLSPILPPRTLRTIVDASGGPYLYDFTALTPIILYNNNDNDNDTDEKKKPHQDENKTNDNPLPSRHRRPSQSAPPQYHQSPYWSGQVRINPFSPIPEQYLRSPPPPPLPHPTSVPLETKDSRKRQHLCSSYSYAGGVTATNQPLRVDGITNNDRKMLGTNPDDDKIMALPPAKKTRFYPPMKEKTITECNSNNGGKNNGSGKFNSEAVPTKVLSVLPIVEHKDVHRHSSESVVLKYCNGGDENGRKTNPSEPESKVWEEIRRSNTVNRDNNINNNIYKKKDYPRRLGSGGRYLNDFQEVQFLGAGSFGSVCACLSRLDGCMYAVKSISPPATSSSRRTRGMYGCGGGGGGFVVAGGDIPSRKKMDNEILSPCGRDDEMKGGGMRMKMSCENNESLQYYGKISRSSGCMPRRESFPPPSPQRRKKSLSRLVGISLEECNLDNDDGDSSNNERIEGCRHWNEAALQRVLREVFALAALCQQDDYRTFHIVRYHQAWLEEDGTLYIQTELCSATLREQMSKSVVIGDDKNNFIIINNNDNIHNRSGNYETDLSPANDAVGTRGQGINVFRQLKILREVLLALELVHQQGMVHLDIKPENIFFKNDLYKLGDFGLANAFSATTGGVTTSTDIDEGDSRYMSKDLLDNSPKDLTKCDIFSLGATMYEVCSQHPLPSCGQDWHDLRNGKPPLLSSTMPSLSAIIKEMMHPDPNKRPSAVDLLSRDTLQMNTHDVTNQLQRRIASSYTVLVDRQAPSTKAPLLTRSASWTV